MLNSSHLNCAAAISLLRDVSEFDLAHTWLRQLTDPEIPINDIAMHRLTKHNSAYPLLTLIPISGLEGFDSELLEALAATHTLTSLPPYYQSDDFVVRLASVLKTLPSVRCIRLDLFPFDAGAELLQSRKNWSSIALPDLETCFKLRAFAPVNETDFKLHLPLETGDGAGLEPWLRNPHLTALVTGNNSRLPKDLFDALQFCENLTELVRHLFCGTSVLDTV
jgi:hypothetical protein